MNFGLYSAVSAMDAAERRLEAVASNLANASTTAYKRRGATFHSYETARRDPLQRVVATRARIDSSQGELIRTGAPLDLALRGEGFFAVEQPNGEAYTRNGHFRLTDEGVLVTDDGFPVAFARKSGAIDPNGEAISIDAEGAAFQGENEIGRLKLVAFENAEKLRQDELGYFHAPRGLREQAYTAEVHQGTLEGSNVNPVEEMVALIETQRSFQTAANVLSKIEQSYRRLTGSQ